MSNEENTIEISLVLIGDSCVGKTSIINRYINNDFKKGYFSIQNEFYTKTIMFDNMYIKFIIRDPFVTDDFFYASHPGSRIKSDVFILVYDITNKRSFDRLKNYWFEYLKRNFRNNTSKIKYL